MTGTPHDATGLIKSYLRALPDPLIPSNLYQSCMSAWALGEDKRERALSLVLLNMPEAHSHCSTFLFKLFKEVADSSDANMMDASNLANVLAPNLLRRVTDKDSTYDEDDLTNHNACVDIVTTLINKPELFNRVPDDIKEQAQSETESEAEDAYFNLLQGGKKQK